MNYTPTALGFTVSATIQIIQGVSQGGVEGYHTSAVPSLAGTVFKRDFTSDVTLVQGAWLRWIRREQRNQSLLGQATDLGDFLFGNDRSVLASYVPLLTELQNGRCFYCGRNLNQRGEVDHFIPWSRYPVDLGHNFVLAHKNCNGSKGNLLSATPHLENWKERNELCGSEMGAYCDEHGLVSDLDTSYSIACWSYAQAENTGAHLWFDKQRLDIAGNDWKRVLTPCSTPCFGP